MDLNSHLLTAKKFTKESEKYQCFRIKLLIVGLINIEFHYKEPLFRNELNSVLKVLFIKKISHCQKLGDFFRDPIS